MNNKNNTGIIILLLLVISALVVYLIVRPKLLAPISPDAIPSTQTAVTNDNNNQTPPMAVCAPSVTVLSPNGGEVYQAGQKITVRWKSCNLLSSDRIAIGLLRNYNNGFGFVEGSRVYGLQNDGIETFTLPSGENAGNVYKISVDITRNDQEWDQEDLSDNSFTINASQMVVNLSTFSSIYIGSNPSDGPWPPVVQTSGVLFSNSCPVMSRNVFGLSMMLSGTLKTVKGKEMCKYVFSDVGAGHHAEMFTYTAQGIQGSTKRIDFRIDWPSCGGYGGVGDLQYDQCIADQTMFLSNIDVYIASLI